MRYREFCLVCKQRITDVGWDPVCCEVCWDSLDAEERRWCDGQLTHNPECRFGGVQHSGFRIEPA